MADDDAFPDLGKLLEQAEAMQQQLQEARAAAASQEIVGQSGGGAVRITTSGALEFTNVQIDQSVVDPTDVAMLEDLVLAALRDAISRANTLSEEALGEVDLGQLGGGLLG